MLSHSFVAINIPMGGAIRQHIYHDKTFAYTDSSDDDSYTDEFDPILEKIDSARRQLYQSTLYAKALAAQELLFYDSTTDESDEDSTSKATYKSKKEARLQAKHLKISSFLNLSSTFLYMTNYYIITPTSGHYAEKLGSTTTFSGIIIGMTPCAALISAILYSWWANYSYKSALLCASACSILGNILYAIALPYNSLTLIILGRLINGFGGARAINRRFIADAFKKSQRTTASAAFVTAGSLGMSAGPAIAALVAYFPVPPTNRIWTHETAPGYIMFVLWTIYFITTFINFREPTKIHHTHNSNANNNGTTHTSQNDMIDYASTQQDQEQHELTPILQNKPSKPTKSKLNLLKNTPVMTTLIIYFVLKLVLECLLSSAAIIGSYNFNWGSKSIGTFLANLGLLMFPSNIAVANLSQRYEDREIIYGSLLALTLGTTGILSFGNSYLPIQYIVFGILIFLSTNILECVNMSLLSKTIPKHMAKGTFNSGLLATEAGTLGRAMGDVYIFAVGAILSTEYARDHFLNFTFGPLAVISIMTVLLTHYVYEQLEENEDDDEF